MINAYNSFDPNAASTIAEQQKELNDLLKQELGKTLGDVTFSVDEYGNVTGGIDGIEGASNTVNINDLLDDALSQVEIPSFESSELDLFGVN